MHPSWPVETSLDWFVAAPPTKALTGPRVPRVHPR